jgi:shikimate kinase
MIITETKAGGVTEVFEERGETYFRTLEERCIDGLASIGSGVIVATGGGLPAIPGMMDRLNRMGTCIYLKASLDTLWKRLCIDPRQLEDRPLLKDSGEEGLRRLLKDREQIYSQAAIMLDTDKLSVDEVCHLVAAQIESLIAPDST